jgi:hypothetical protein
LFKPFTVKSATIMRDGCQIRCAGVVPGSTNVVEASSDLLGWTPISTNVASTGELTIMDSTATNFNQRFYRVKRMR